MKRSVAVFALVWVMTLASSAAGLAFSSVQSSAATPKTSNSALVAKFREAMTVAHATRFVATYRLAGYQFLGNGTVVVAQIPSPPGTNVTTNVDGYSGSGRMAYEYHGTSGRIVQWIKNGTNVSACVNVLLHGTYDSGAFAKLECSRPSPYLPSNGYALEDIGFVPTFVDQSLTTISPTQTTVSTSSSRFGELQCLIQTAGTEVQTTCINHTGNVVSWLLQNGSGFSRAILSSLKHDPTANDFKTLVAPTRALILPPV